MEEYFKQLKRHVELDSREELFQYNIHQNLLKSDELKYSDNDIDDRKNYKGFIPDLTISFGDFKLFIEVKRLFENHPTVVSEGLNQLACYIKKEKLEFGILTDSKNWIIIQNHPTRLQYRIVFSFVINDEIDKNSKDFLINLSKGRIRNFINFCSKLTEKKDFNWLLRNSLWTDDSVFQETIKSVSTNARKGEINTLQNSIFQRCTNDNKIEFGPKYFRIDKKYCG